MLIRRLSDVVRLFITVIRETIIYTSINTKYPEGRPDCCRVFSVIFLLEHLFSGYYFYQMLVVASIFKTIIFFQFMT